MRILVTGSRDWDDRIWIATVLNHHMLERWRTHREPVIVVHGHCPTGADAMADGWAVANGMEVERHPAKWREHGIYNPQAGLLRNREMVALGADICVAFIRNGSRGATHCADLAQEAGIPTWRYTA